MDTGDYMVTMNILTHFATTKDEGIEFEKFLEITGYRDDGAFELLESLVARKILSIASKNIVVGEIGFPVLIYLGKKSKENNQS